VALSEQLIGASHLASAVCNLLLERCYGEATKEIVSLLTNNVVAAKKFNRTTAA
jgi:hypothetical protein